MQQSTRYFAAWLCAGLLTACGGGGGGGSAGSASSSMLPGTPAQSTQSVGSSATVAASSVTTDATFPNSNRVGFEGKIVASRTGGGYTMLGNASQGYVVVNTTSSTTMNTHNGSASAGHYALVAGGGSVATAISAIYITTFAAEPGAITMHGTYVGATTYGFEMNSGSAGSVPVITDTTTSLTGTLTAGEAITVEGIGTSETILATSVAAAGTDPTYPSTISQTHLVTADYLGTPWGTTTVSASTAAPHLNWAETGLANTSAISAAGIKTMVYFDMGRVQSNDPMYSQLSGAEYEETCSGARVSDYWDGVTQYVVNPASSATRAAIDSYITSATAGYTVNAIFEDDADPLSQYAASYFTSGLACDYADSTWITGEQEMLAGYGHDVFVNGFSRMTSATPITNTTQLLTGSTIGGNMESCYVEVSSPNEEGVWVWTDTEDTALKVTGESKYFECWAMDATTASSAVASRIYTLASFLLTYNPTYSILREGYATPSQFHVMPESQLVPQGPVVAQPATVSTLEESSVYVREYRACYYAGKLIGQCAMVVNNDNAAHGTPALALTYAHTLTLSGNGILDGGSVGFKGAAPPASVAARSAFIAVP